MASAMKIINFEFMVKFLIYIFCYIFIILK
jgi:hypothetical protein